MATRSTIAKVNDDGSITSIYCHWDGYPEGVGKTLKNHYTDVDKIDQLLALGDVSILAPELGEPHDFDNPTEGWTLAYGRDRGETGVDAVTHSTLDEWKQYRSGSGCEYGYLWMSGTTVWTTFTFYASQED